MHAILATRMHYQLWEVDRARRGYQSEYPMPLLFLRAIEEPSSDGTSVMLFERVVQAAI
jgi:hypothetical protein